jgi:predicted phage terminase large subunit-like protein
VEGEKYKPFNPIHPSYKSRAKGQYTREFSYSLQDLPCDTPQVSEDTVSLVKQLRQENIKVYDIQVEGNNNFFANGVLVHNCLIIDDPHKDRKEAESLKMRSNVWDWFRSTAYTRLEDNGAVIVIMTRWHEGDLVGCLLSGEEKWDVVSLPAIAEQSDSYRNEGDPLWIKKYNLADLNNIRTAIGSREWISLYQQRPTAADGEIFKREYWRYYRELPIFEKIIHSWDTAFKTGKDNDYSVGTVWGIAKNGYYLLYRWKDRVEFPELKRTVVALFNQIPGNEIVIEDKASGQSLIQELQRDNRLPIIPFKSDNDKVARANAASPVIEAGKVFLPEGAEWLQDYIDTMAAFPKAIHDDDVDSTTMALLSMQSRQKYSFASL